MKDKKENKGSTSPSKEAKEAKKVIQSLKLSMLAHPDCTDGSEFDDYATTAQDIEFEIELIIKEATT